MESIMLLNGENRAGLGTARSFGKKGIPVFAGGCRVLSRTLYSKYCRRRFVYSSSSFGIERMHEDILRNVKKFQPDVLFPLFSDTTYAVLKHLDEYEKYCRVIPTLDFKRYCIFIDKKGLLKEARKVGTNTAKTFYPKNLDSVKELSAKLNYPVLIKPRIGQLAQGIVKVSSPSELTQKYLQVSSQRSSDFAYDPRTPTIQEFVPGDISTVYVLFEKGRHIASMVCRFERVYPVPYGAQLTNSTQQNEELRSLAVTMFRKLRWHGAANCHFIKDERDNTYKLIEINPRIWGTVESSIEAGVDFPYMMYRMALGEKIRETTQYKLGQTFRWILFGEFAYLLKSSKKLATFRNYLRFKNTKTEIDVTDAVPHVMHFLDLLINKSVL
jgi:predicted ATP-grasp superfamily ATP-dependent carboligase